MWELSKRVKLKFWGQQASLGADWLNWPSVKSRSSQGLSDAKSYAL